MKFEPARCPTCNGEAIGIHEVVPGMALLDLQEDGSYEYAGETEVWWDDQKPVKDAEGRATLFCANEHGWSVQPVEDGPSDPLAGEIVHP